MVRGAVGTELERDLAWVRNQPVAASLLACWAAFRVRDAASQATGSWEHGVTLAADERRVQCDLLRDVFGNPFGPPPTVDPAWLAWGDGLVRRLAAAAYEQRELPSGTLDAVRLAVLADALEEAGCADPNILGHLRGPGPHVRGCWPVDLLLGRE